LVDDLLDVSRIIKGKIQLERGLVNMKASGARHRADAAGARSPVAANRASTAARAGVLVGAGA